MAFAPTKREQLKMTCISFALELNLKRPITELDSGYRTMDYIIKDAEKIYKWITGE